MGTNYGGLWGKSNGRYFADPAGGHSLFVCEALAEELS